MMDKSESMKAALMDMILKALSGKGEMEIEIGGEETPEEKEKADKEGGLAPEATEIDEKKGEQTLIDAMKHGSTGDMSRKMMKKGM